MALTRFTKETNIIGALADRPNQQDGLTPAQLKAKFDQIGVDLDEYINDTLISELETGGVLEILRTKSNEMKYIRLNADGALEISADNVTWEATASSGHVILDKDNNELPQRSRLKFANSTISDDGTATTVNGIQGDQGIQGIQGVQGDKGDKGDKGDTGYSIIPAVDQNTGLMSFSEGPSGVVPASVSVRGSTGATRCSRVARFDRSKKATKAFKDHRDWPANKVQED